MQKHTPSSVPARTPVAEPLPPSAAPAICLEGVSKIFGTSAVLRNLSHVFEPGTITLLLGENGSGKSTLLRLLAGLTQPTRGTIQVLGERPRSTRNRVAYMSHAAMLYDELSAIENLTYFARLHRDGGCDCVGSPEMALRAVNLDPHLKRPVGEYSQGMRQRASLARVLQLDPVLLLLDEPFSNLDAASARQMVELLADFRTWPVAGHSSLFRDAGDAPAPAYARTILLTTHQAHLAEPIADNILTLRNGSLHRVDDSAAA